MLDAETRYTNTGKLVYALILSSRKLRPYFQAHKIEVRIAFPLRQIIHKPEATGRMLKWAIELGQFDLEYKPRTEVKGQALAYLILEFPPDVGGDEMAIVLAQPSTQPDSSIFEIPDLWWTLHVDGAVNNEGAGDGIILISPEGHTLMSVINFTFKATNNDAEYEALLGG